MTTAPRIVFAASLWTLEGHPSPKREWSLARKVRAAADAGFDAVLAGARPELKPLLAKHGLRFTGFFASSNAREFAAAIRAQRVAGAETINVQLGDDWTPAEQTLKLARALLREAKRQGVYVGIESHRDTATETPEKLYALVDAFQRATGESLPITWDFSHLAVVKHLKPLLFSETLLARPQLIQSARLFHCRPFNGQHAQVPVFDNRGRLTREFKDWLPFVEDLFTCWLAGPRPGNEICVCPEMGPVSVHGYNLTTLPPSWEQAIVCRRELTKVWRRLGGAFCR
jgi:hypothetical protein